MAAGALLAPWPSAAAPPASSDQGLVYPLQSFLDWARGPADNLADSALVANTLKQEVLNAIESVAGLGKQVDPSHPAATVKTLTDQLLHLRPDPGGLDLTEMADPRFLPDFDHDGVFGDPDDFVTMLHTPSTTGYFLYPCLSDQGSVSYETTAGPCTAAGTQGVKYKRGLAQTLTITDARGIPLAATLWLPAAALSAGCPTAAANATDCRAPTGLAARSALDGGRGLPTVVIADGLASAQDSYFWLAMSLVRAGYVVVTYDPAGQGHSGGSVADLLSPPVPNCEFAGACRDLEDVVRWTVGQTAPGGSPNPALAVVDHSRVAAIGHSMGALSLLNYLWYQGRAGLGIDGRPLPRLAAGVALSGAAPTSATVPVQFQTSDFDGSPSLVGPAVGGIDLGTPGNGIGYASMKPLYDQLRTDGPGNAAMSMVVLEGGVHTDFIDTPFIPRTPWSWAVSSRYALAWLGCHVRGVGGDCASAVAPSPHLSSSFASEYAAAGSAPRPSTCITVPTTASLNDPLTGLLGALGGRPSYTCTRDH